MEINEEEEKKVKNCHSRMIWWGDFIKDLEVYCLSSNNGVHLRNIFL